jgi:hypothetical protein
MAKVKKYKVPKQPTKAPAKPKKTAYKYKGKPIPVAGVRG